MIACYIVMCPLDGRILGKKSSNTMGDQTDTAPVIQEHEP